MVGRRPTPYTTAPGAEDSATIRPLSSARHRRRRPTPTRISTPPRRSEASTIWSTIYANRSHQISSHLAAQLAWGKVGTARRFPSRGHKNDYREAEPIAEAGQ